jgi:hypothetical protein
MNRFYKPIGYVIVAIAIIFFVSFASKHASVLSLLKWNFMSYASFGFGIFLSIVTIFFGGYAWYLLLRFTGQPSRLGKVLAIFSIAQFAKYIPGNIAHHIGRVALAKAYGFKVPIVIFTMVVEAAWLILAASTLSILSLIAARQVLFKYMPSIPSLWQIMLLIIAAAMIPLIGYWTLNYWRPHFIQKLFGVEKIESPNMPILVVCFLLYSANLFLNGLIMVILSQNLFGVEGSQIWLLSGIFAIAWVAGFLTPGSPAGLGVREAIIVASLSLIYNGKIAVGLAISTRVVSTLADGLTFIFAIIAKRRFFPISVQINGFASKLNKG